jgi:asparagine synthase (glutamine-hydrolysing)
MDMVVERTGVTLEEVRPTPERFEASLETIARQQDEPFGSTSIAAQWFVFEAAKAAGMKVMLDGQGADEVLGGYHGYLATIAAGMVSDRRPLAYARLALDHRRRLGTWPLAAGSMIGLLPERVLGAAARVRSLDRRERRPQPALGGVLAEPLERSVPVLEPLPTDLQALLRHQVQMSLPSLLRYEDRNSMAHSIEARVPFLDHRLVELAFQLPAETKVRRADTKRLLREAMRGVLPEPIRTRRDKLGFRADPGASPRFARARRDLLAANASAAEGGWFDPAAVRAFIDAAQVDPALEFPLWRIVNVKLWARAHWPA